MTFAVKEYEIQTPIRALGKIYSINKVNKNSKICKN